MAKFIELTIPTGHAGLFNVDTIVFITPLMKNAPQRAEGANTAIAFVNGHGEKVVETIKEIQALIDA